ncbi:hypothetical protein TI04_06660 [Achromatium sp. WMS2]|nr:hypothetical protein TI04_06660 [Achromatium sp. WMS2]
MHKNTELYHQDFYAWINSQVTLLRQGRVQELNQEFLAEELEDMSRHHRNELVSRLIILIAHLLKWQYQPKRRSSSWRDSIMEQRVQIEHNIDFSPSLKPFLHEAIAAAYPKAVRLASKETKLDKSVFPETCPYQPQELLDEDYWPE